MVKVNKTNSKLFAGNPAKKLRKLNSAIQKPKEKIAIKKQQIKKALKTKNLESSSDQIPKKQNNQISSKPEKPNTETATEKRIKTEAESERESFKHPSIKHDVVKSAVEINLKLVQKFEEDHKTLFEDGRSIFLQFTAVKIPKCPLRRIFLPLKHNICTESCEICFFVPDPPNIRKKDTEQVDEYYEELLRSKNITNIKTVMPLYRLKTEYDTFELKRRLVELYDVFLVDGKISGYTKKMLGKIFFQKRKLPTCVRLENPNLKSTIDSALKKTSFKLHCTGDSYVVQVAHSKMAPEEIVENVFEVLKGLEKEFPGGFDNIKCLHLKTENTTAVPIYFTLKDKTTVKIPVVKAKRPKAAVPVTDELSTYKNKKVTVFPSGKIELEDLDTKEDVEDDEMESDYFDDNIDDEEEENVDDDDVVGKKRRKANAIHKKKSEIDVDSGITNQKMKIRRKSQRKEAVSKKGSENMKTKSKEEKKAKSTSLSTKSKGKSKATNKSIAKKLGKQIKSNNKKKPSKAMKKKKP